LTRRSGTADGATSETLPGGSTATPCPVTGPSPSSFSLDWEFPMLIAAVDPQAEAKLDGLRSPAALESTRPSAGPASSAERGPR